MLFYCCLYSGPDAIRRGHDWRLIMTKSFDDETIRLLGNAETNAVGGGLNPQPLPPRWLQAGLNPQPLPPRFALFGRRFSF